MHRRHPLDEDRLRELVIDEFTPHPQEQVEAADMRSGKESGLFHTTEFVFDVSTAASLLCFAYALQWLPKGSPQSLGLSTACLPSSEHLR